MRWPWTSRARLDDALGMISEQKTRIAQLETEVRHLVDQIFVRHGVRPVFADPKAATAVAPPPVPVEPQNPMDAKIPTLLDVARRGGARSARQILRNADAELIRRHREKQSAQMTTVVKDLTAILESPTVPGTNGSH